MRILILTSKDHMYANVILSELFKQGAFTHDEVTIGEQDWIVPRKSTLAGLRKYIEKSGLRYVVAQACKQYLFKFLRAYKTLIKDRHSPYASYKLFIHPKTHIMLLQDFKNERTKAFVTALKPDLILSILSKEVIPSDILALPTHGAVNVHPALLPSYKGMSPTFWCMANGETQTGATLHVMDATIDTGAILLQEPISLIKHHTEHSLYMEASRKTASMLMRYLAHRDSLKPLTLDTSIEPSYFSFPTKEAINAFYKRGYSFFRLSEFFGSHT
jgi:hypothetical protein